MRRQFLTAAAVLTTLLGGMALAGPAQAAGPASVSPHSLCSAGWYYRSTGRGADSLAGVGSAQSDYNGTGSNADVTFSSQVSGTVSATLSGSTNIGLSVEVASISSTYGISATVSKSVTLGNQIRITVPPYRTGNGQYGAWRAYVTGVEEYYTANCAVTKSSGKTIWTPYKAGWNTWIS